MYYIILHCITLYYIVLHYITLYYIILHYITLYCIILHCITLYYIILRYITLYYIILRYCKGSKLQNAQEREGQEAQRFPPGSFASMYASEIARRWRQRGPQAQPDPRQALNRANACPVD